MPNEEVKNLQKQIVEISIHALKHQKVQSVQLVATRALVRYARKVSQDDLMKISAKFETVLDDLLQLLEHSQKEVMHLPI